MEHNFLRKSDYEEPCCPLSKPGNVTSIPVRRVIEKLDEYLNRNDYPAAERHLRYWQREAEAGNDKRGKLTILNEQIGLYRKCKKEAEGLGAIRDALALADEIGMEDTVTMGTTLINAATGYKAFGKAGEALPLYRSAQKIYEAALQPTDERLGGLYNNMALTLMELEDYREAETLFFKALDIMAQNRHREAEMAITCCNLADLVAAETGITDGEKQITEYLEKAQELLDTEDLPRDGYYAFVCEKCAPTFGYYGYFLFEKELTERAERIYERT